MTKETQNLSHPKYRSDIDGLRAVAVLSVVFYHAFPGWVKGGFIGVDIFFVISGFLISTIIFENLERNSFNFYEFYGRRIRRIFPALIVVLTFCLALGWLILVSDELNQLGRHIAAGVGFVSNFVLWGEAGYFDNEAETKPLLHLWSLGIEEQFYIVWPFLLWFAWKSRINLLAVAAILTIASLILNLVGIRQDPVSVFYLPLTRFWELLCGSILAWLALYRKLSFHSTQGEFKNWFNANGVFPNIASALGCGLLGYGFYAISKEVSFPGWWAVIPVLGTALIILGGPKAWINRRLLSNRLVVWFGLISFPLYLWHWPLLSFANILEGSPSRTTKIVVVILSILLAWLTVRFVERYFRFGNENSRIKVQLLCSLALIVGFAGLLVGWFDFSESRNFQTVLIKRNGSEHAIGSSLSWYRGKDDWLFLGNRFDSTVAKLKLAAKPAESQLIEAKDGFGKVVDSGVKFGIKTVLIVGPNKSSIYPEYLPDELNPSDIRYSSFFLDKLKGIPNLEVYDPTNDLLGAKSTEGFLYWKTDTHWNAKGAFVTFSAFTRKIGIEPPLVTFEYGSAHSGDLIKISKLKDFPLDYRDNWSVVWKERPVWIEEEVPNERKTSFGTSTLVTNSRPISEQYVWVIGDSFTEALKQYFNATFSRVRYVGHWQHKLKGLPEAIEQAENKPDLIVIVRVERSF